MVLVHKTNSPLSVIGKLVKMVIAKVTCRHLSDKYLLSNQDFGFRHGRSISDMLMLYTTNWRDVLDSGQDTAVVALDTAGAFDRVWHEGLS